MKAGHSSSPQIGILTMFRLGLFNLGLGLMAVLTLAVLNRVMISELGIPGSVTAGTLAMSQLVAPARVWFGQLSDVKPLWGLHRSNYVRLGTVIAGLTVFLAIQVVWQLGGVVSNLEGWVWNWQTISLSMVLALILAAYGLAISASSTPFTAMLVDISDDNQRSRLISIVWSMLMVGIVIGGITGSVVLKNTDNLQATINRVFIFAPLLVMVLAWIATWGIEKNFSRHHHTSVAQQREDSITLRTALRILTATSQTFLFFTFLMVITLGLFMQEAVLEPYGGVVFGMSIADTTLLNSFWGIGILIGYSLTGFLVVPRLGKTQTTRIGCLLVAGCFGLIILAGFTQQPSMLKLAMILFGIAAGITTIGSISLMLDLTVAETAGTFIGAWGLSQALARALATFSGGLILDIGEWLFHNPLWAYSLVFGLQAVTMVVAIAFLNRVNVQEFQVTTQKAINLVMEGDSDS